MAAFVSPNKWTAVIEMIDLSAWMKQFLQALTETFGSRVWFVGLQGSYIRRLQDLLLKTAPEERRIIDTHLHLKNGGKQ